MDSTLTLDRGCGVIESPEDAIAFTAADLAHIIRISEDTAAEVIRLASVLLFPASKRMCSALSILQTLPRFLTTGDRGLDDLLAGGVPVGCITEIYGESGAGKTQLALQMCATAQWEVERGGLASPVIYIATEQRFPLDRFAEICSSFEDRGLLPAAALVDNSPSQSSSSSPSSLSNAPETIPIPPFSRYGENVHLIHLRDAETQHHIISYQLPTVLERTGARLVIVDSVAANFRGGIRFDVDDPTGETQVTTGGGGGMGDWADARDERFEMADAVFRLGQALKRSADRFGAAVVCVNQVSADVAGDGAGGTVFVGTGVTAGAGKGFTQVSRQTVDGGGGAEGGHWSIIAGAGSGGVVPTLGLAWTGAVNVRLKMSKGRRRVEDGGPVGSEENGVRVLPPRVRTLSVVFAPHVPPRSCEFVISRNGVSSLNT